jgi:putative Ca2+/H+ antiporter (TMEM165/GDT1 family)
LTGVAVGADVGAFVGVAVGTAVALAGAAVVAVVGVLQAERSITATIRITGVTLRILSSSSFQI